MVEVRNISSVPDLRGTVFADLFYGVLDSDDKSATANGIARSIDSRYVEQWLKQGLKEAKEEREGLYELIENLEERRSERKKRERELEAKILLSAGDRALEDLLRTSNEFLVKLYSFSIEEGDDEVAREERWQSAFDNDDETKVLFDKVVDDLLNNGFLRERLVRWVASSEIVYDGVIAEIRSRLGGAGSSRKKHIDALLLLPKIDDDQDMIVFFGNNFHKTFEEVNAYTGLLYAYEYFEHVGMV